MFRMEGGRRFELLFEVFAGFVELGIDEALAAGQAFEGGDEEELDCADGAVFREEDGEFTKEDDGEEGEEGGDDDGEGVAIGELRVDEVTHGLD